jgi:hypothetical protein
MHPFSFVLNVSATQAVTISGLERPQYVESWCQVTRGIMRILDKESRAPAQNVRPQDGFNAVEDASVAYQLVQAGQKEVRFAVERRGQPAVMLGFEGFQSAAPHRYFFVREDGQWEQKALLLILS